jgi:hypothetical protein
MDSTENYNVRLALCEILAALMLCAAVALFFHAAPCHETPTAAITAPPADCLPSGSGGPCIPFDQIQKMMRVQPDASEPVPQNPAATNEETI